MGHGGTWAGFLTDFTVSADRRLAVAVSCNGDPKPANEVSQSLLDEWT